MRGIRVVYDMNPEESAVAAIFQWTAEGKRQIVFPTSLAEGKIQLPAGFEVSQIPRCFVKSPSASLRGILRHCGVLFVRLIPQDLLASGAFTLPSPVN